MILRFLRKIVLTVLLVLSITQAFSQRSLDSLKNVLRQPISDSHRVATLHRIAYTWHLTKPDSTIYYCNRAIQLAKKIGEKKGEAISNNYLGLAYRMKGDFPAALKYYFEGLRGCEEVRDTVDIGFACGGIAAIYSVLKQDEQCLVYSLRALKMLQCFGEPKRIASAYSDVANAYRNLNNLPLALENYNKARILSSKTGSAKTTAVILFNLGDVYRGLKKYDSALVNYSRALALEKNTKSNVHWYIYNGMGKVYSCIGKFAESEKCFLRALQISDSTGRMENKKNSYLQLSKLYDTTGRISLAYCFYKKYAALKDSLFNSEKNKDMGKLEAQYTLNKQKAIEEAKHRKELEFSKNAEKDRRKILYCVVAALAVVIGFAFVIFNRFRLTKKQKATIEEQKLVVELKQKEIMDSIYYARRIQRSLLPTEKYFDTQLKTLTKTVVKEQDK